MKNKTVIVTGAASGIGKAAAQLFASAGANVVVSDIHTLEGEKIAEEICIAGGKASFFRIDVAVAAEMEALVAFTIKTYGKLDIAVSKHFFHFGSSRFCWVCRL
jgi:NAD(P)-dependent dehydrogenase (short-subunit alcohol dehydrogenase family)